MVNKEITAQGAVLLAGPRTGLPGGKIRECPHVMFLQVSRRAGRVDTSRDAMPITNRRIPRLRGNGLPPLGAVVCTIRDAAGKPPITMGVE